MNVDDVAPDSENMRYANFNSASMKYANFCEGDLGIDTLATSVGYIQCVKTKIRLRLQKTTTKFKIKNMDCTYGIKFF